MTSSPRTSNSDSGAILVHVAIAIIALMGFLTFVVDNGVFMTSRAQAQNSADAGALAGAISKAAGASEADAVAVAVYVAQRNGVWGNGPAATAAYVDCPDDGTIDGCIRAEVFRNTANANALPTFFAMLVGRGSQDMRATATAKVVVANATDCLKPWAVIDKWSEHWPTTTDWTKESTFDKYNKQGDPDPAVPTPDVYVAPTATDPGTGFHPFDEEGDFTDDYGLQLDLKVGDKSDFGFATGWFSALALTDSTGGKDYKNNIKGCVGTVYKIGDELEINTEPGEKVGPTKQGVEDDTDSLVNQDPGAYWDSSLNDGLGGVAGSAFKSSPRIVAIPLVNPDIMADAQKGGRTTVPIANIAGFFVEGYNTAEKSVTGRLVTMPGLLAAGGPTVGGPSAFLTVVVLIR